MLSVILNIVSESTDLFRYNELLSDGDSLITIHNCENIVALYNKAINETDENADILLLSDRIDLHDMFLENMRSCLYAADKHAIVYGQEIADNKGLVETARKYLPGYSLTIQANSDCAFLKRTVINTLGFFDDSYSSLQYALMDYYCRINKFGFSSVTSHHALISYRTGRKDTECSADKELFISTYEYWEEKKRRYALHGTHPCVEFLELLDSEYYPKKRILFDCVIMPLYHCGTSEYQIAVFDAFYRLYKDKYDIFLYISHEADAVHKLSGKYDNIFYPETLSGTFHLGFAPNQLMFYEPQETMNRCCLKVIQTVFDIIMVRIDEHTIIDTNSDVELGIKLSDGIVFISDNTKNDFMSCFTDQSSIKDKQLRVIYPATGITAPVKDYYELPFEEYFLVIGNSYKHKSIKETIKAISGIHHNFIIVGFDNNDYIHPNIYSFKSGLLDDDLLSYLYANCKAVIFPSLYEGFGFPVVISLKNHKRVIVNDNNLNRELEKHFDQFRDHFLFFSSFTQIGEIIENTNFLKEITQVEYADSWDRVAIELESFFSDIIGTETDPEKLNERWHVYKLVEGKLAESSLLIKSLRAELASLYNQFNSYKLPSLLFFAIKEHVKKRHPRLFKALKGDGRGY